MKVAKWKVLTVAGALILGYAVSSQAVQLKVDEDTFANFGANMKIFYKNIDKLGGATDYRQNVFYVDNFRFYIDGQLNKMVQFFADLDTHSFGITELSEAGINLVFTPEFQVRVAQGRVPFTRYQITDDYAELIPTSPGRIYSPLTGNTNIDPQGVIPATPYGLSPIHDGRVDGGVVFHGEVAEGMLRYNVGIFDDNRAGKSLKSFEYAVRVEFTPTMAGFSPAPADEASGREKDTYFGKKNILTIGVGYDREKVSDNPDLTRNGYTIDALYESKFGVYVPNVQVAYIKLNDSHTYGAGKKGDTTAWYIQGQVLYDQVIGLGKPAVAVRYDYINADKDNIVKRLGVALNYYIKGEALRATLGFDYISYDDAAKAAAAEDSLTNFYLCIQTKF